MTECTVREDRWCPLHGKCSCTTYKGVTRIWDVQVHEDCSLHGAKSTHPFPEKSLRMVVHRA